MKKLILTLTIAALGQQAFANDTSAFANDTSNTNKIIKACKKIEKGTVGKNYIPVLFTKNGKLVPGFITVKDIKTNLFNKYDTIIVTNENNLHMPTTYSTVISCLNYKRGKR